MKRVKLLVAGLLTAGAMSFGLSANAADVVVVNSGCSICPTTKTIVVDYGVPQCILDKTCVYLQHADQCVLNCGQPDCGGCCGSAGVVTIIEK
jgi:hypothetical protein